MIAILIHFIGHLMIDSAVPPYIESADAWFLAKWYVAFAGVDAIALCMCTKHDKWVRIVLALWFGWSLALAVEQTFLLDYMQRYDWAANYLLDISLVGLLVTRYAPAFNKASA